MELCMTADTYRAAFGEDPQPNLLYCRLAEGVDTAESEGRLATDLLKCRDVAGAQFTHEITASFTQSIDSINYIVVVLIVAAGALAFVVLYNLTNINITERAKELATIKVLGFFDGEVAAYIYRETAILTLIGTGCSLLFGIALHSLSLIHISFVIADHLRFGRIARAVYMDDYRYQALRTLTRARFDVIQNLTWEKQRFANYLFLKCSGMAQDKDIQNTSATTIALMERFETVDDLANANLDELTAFCLLYTSRCV